MPLARLRSASAIGHSPSSSTRAVQLATGDTDRDGDIDVYAGLLSGERGVLFTNRARSLEALTVPHIGRRLEIELRGRPFELYELSAATASVAPGPGAGTAPQLDPAQRLLVRRGRLDGNGRAVLGFDVPLSRRLEGVDIFWQARVRDGSTWSNLERTTLRMH